MRPHLFSLIVAGIFLASLPSALATSPAPPQKTKKEQNRSTLSELGIDFGAAELVRYTELDLSKEQKKQALTVVKTRKPRIENLCTRMTKALAMDESTLELKRVKEAELATILEQFKAVQVEIIKGLHALVTKEQMAKLEEIKKAERKKEVETG